MAMVESGPALSLSMIDGVSVYLRLGEDNLLQLLQLLSELFKKGRRNFCSCFNCFNNTKNNKKSFLCS